MEALARPHTEAEGGRLRLLPIPDEIEPGSAQDPFCYRFKGDKQPIALVDIVAAQTEPRFPGLIEGMQADPQVTGVINETGRLLEDEKNIWVISPHGDILDIAYVLKATYNLLHQQDYTPRRTISVLSKALARVGFELDPDLDPIETVPTMGMLCDDVFLTWPRTKSAKGAVSQLPKAEVEYHNARATQEMDEEFTEGSVLAAMAPTGTTRMSKDHSGAFILPVPSRGTLELMMKAGTYVLPVPAWFKSEEAMMAMPVEPVEISEESDAHEMFKYLAEVMTERIDGIDFTYKTPRRTSVHAALQRHKPSKP